MKQLSWLLCTFFLLFITSWGCAIKQPLLNKENCPSIKLGESFITNNTEYKVSVSDIFSEELVLTATNISENHPFVTIKIFTANDVIKEAKDSHIALLLRKGQSYTFNLSFKTSDLPIKIDFIEEYDTKKAHKSGFIVGIPKKKSKTPKVKEIPF